MTTGVTADTSELIPLRLDLDESKPADERRTFWIKTPTMRTCRMISIAYDSMSAKEQTATEFYKTMTDALRAVLVKWDNVRDAAGAPLPISEDTLLDTLTTDQGFELLGKVLDASRLKGEDKKKLA